jgi:hypothetical protein
MLEDPGIATFDAWPPLKITVKIPLKITRNLDAISRALHVDIHGGPLPTFVHACIDRAHGL